MGEPQLKLEGIEITFNKNKILENINLDINKGEIVGITGLSGAGKTTLLKIIAGYLNPNKGKMLYKAKNGNYVKKNLLINKHIGFATQDSSFYPDLTVYENIRYFSALYNMHKLDEVINKLISIVGLSDEKNKLAMNLSDGMKKRLDLVCSLVHNPKIWILDEPTANIDYKLKTRVYNIIKVINKQGKTIILSSHNLDDLKSLCNKIYEINDKTISEKQF